MSFLTYFLTLTSSVHDSAELPAILYYWSVKLVVMSVFFLSDLDLNEREGGQRDRVRDMDRERQRDIEAERQRGREAERQSERDSARERQTQRMRETDRQTDREREREREGERERARERERERERESLGVGWPPPVQHPGS